jgi:hypothetical protein
VCHGCGERTAVGTKFYCPDCRAEQCRECKHFAGEHGSRCRYAERRHRLPRLTGFNAVTADHVIALFNTYQSKAVRFAQFVGNLSRPAAEDVVSDVFLSVWKNRDYFKAPPGRAYPFKAVEHGALRVHQYAWARRVVAMDPPDLVLAEQATYDPTQPAIAVPR